MKLQTCLKIGKDCCFSTVEESIYNIDLRAGQIFAYSEINKELQELMEEANELFTNTDFTEDSKIEDVLHHILTEGI